MQSRARFDTSAIYQIRLEGKVSSRWSKLLCNMAIEVMNQKRNEAETVLTGVLRDQAELFGLLNAIYSLGLILISVERIELCSE